MNETKWILGNNESSHVVHRAAERTTGKDVYYVAACSGKTLGGSWGYTIFKEKPKSIELRDCERCSNFT